jgi:EARLY FLOWERING 3 protein
LLEDGAFLGKATLTVSPAKKLPLKYVIKPPLQVVKGKDNSESPNHKMEFSAENGVGKTCIPSVQSGSQPPNYGPYLGHLQPATMATDNKMAPWSFHQSPGHQWLVPVVSPSEGLIYKPYPGPGYMGAVCGGYGPFNPAPLAGNFMNPAYGVPAHHHHQGIGNIPGTTPLGHTYLPLYGMPAMDPATSGSPLEQANQFAGPGPHDQTQFSGGRANSNMQHLSSHHVPNQKHGAVSQVAKFQASKDSELQGSTASSPWERARGVRTGYTSEGRGDELPLFPTDPVDPEAASQPRETEQPTRVIKVVPYNPRTATESAARIFQSIQEERKLHYSV